MTSSAMSVQNVLYRFYNRDGELLYIGITNNPLRRFSQHRKDKEWWADVANISQQSFESEDALKAAEKKAIQRENPRYNKQFVDDNLRESRAANNTPKVSIIGKYFHSWIDAKDDSEIVRNGKTPGWQGQIISQIAAEKYLVELFSWWDGCPTQQRLCDISEMDGWTFYSNNIEMIARLGCSEHFDFDGRSRRCGAKVIGFAGIKLGLGPMAVCAGCSRFYGDVQLIEVRNGEFHLGKPWPKSDRWDTPPPYQPKAVSEK